MVLVEVEYTANVGRVEVPVVTGALNVVVKPSRSTIEEHAVVFVL